MTPRRGVKGGRLARLHRSVQLGPALLPAAGSVALVGAVGVVAVSFGPVEGRFWLVVAAVFAVIMAVESVASEPRHLTPALLLALVPVLALAAEGSPTWIVGPLGALLLLAGELHALSWKRHGPARGEEAERRRVVRVGQLVAAGLVAGVGVGLMPGLGFVGGTVAVAVAAGVVGVVGAVVFGPSGEIKRSAGSHRG